MDDTSKRALRAVEIGEYSFVINYSRREMIAGLLKPSLEIEQKLPETFILARIRTQAP